MIKMNKELAQLKYQLIWTVSFVDLFYVILKRN